VLAEAPFSLLIIAIIFGGLQLSNFLLDRGVPFVITRKAGGHIFGGIGYLLCPFLFSTAYWPIILSGGFTFLLGISHFLRPRDFRGVGGSSRPEGLSEVLYPASGTACLIFGWLCLGNPWLAVLPCLYLAWGDSITGIVRFLHHRGRHQDFRKYNCGTVAMLIVCLGLALLFKPFWIAALGGIAATLAEKFCGENALIKEDDNGIIPLAAIVTMAPLWVLWG
jgi:dolichol kinase